MRLLHTAHRFVVTSGIVLFRRAPYIFVSFLCLYGSGYIITKFYYMKMPASWFISITERPKIDNGQVNRDLNLTFCRETRYPNIKAQGTRSFYLLQGNDFKSVGSYEFNATIEASQKCQHVAIKPSNHPNVAGRYGSHTDLTFFVNGYRKVLSYDATDFTISDTADSLQKQIQDLQQQINQLKGQQVTDPAVTSSLAAPVIASSQAVPPGLTVFRQNTDTTRPTTPPSSSPPNPPAETTTTPAPVAVVPAQPGLIESTASGLQGTLVTVLQDAAGVLRRTL